MELMTAMPLPKTNPQPRSQASGDKRQAKDENAVEPVSFPTLLQENHRVEKTDVKPGENVVSSNESTSQGDKSEAVATSAATAQAADGEGAGNKLPTASLTGFFKGESPLLGNPATANLPVENQLKTEAVVPNSTAAQILGTAEGQEKANLVAATATAPVMGDLAGSGEAPAQGQPQTQAAAGQPVTAQSNGQLELPTEAGVSKTLGTEVANQGADSAAQAMGDEQKIESPVTRATAPPVPTNTAQLKENAQPIKSIPVPSQSEGLESTSGSDAGKIDTTVLKATANEAATATQTTESIKAETTAAVTEVVAEEAAAVTSEEEAPASAKPVAADVEQIAAQSNAQKSYQPNTGIAQDSSGSAKPTLADLDLGSGSFDSMNQEESSAARLLSQASGTSSSIKRSVRGQVLNRVVDHLQAEMGKEKLTIRLNPEELGQIEVQFLAQGDQLEVVMKASGPEAEMALKEGSRELAESIGEKSIRWNLIDIKVESRGQEQGKQDSRPQEERREKEDQSQNHDQRQKHQNHHPQTEAGEWAAFHLGG